MSPVYGGWRDSHGAVEHLQKIGIKRPLWSTRVLVNEALSRGIEVNRSPKRGIELSHAGVQHEWKAGDLPINSKLAREICRYKNVSTAFFAAKGAPVSTNHIFTSDEPEEAWNWARPRVPIVLKPNDGRQGRGVHVDISSEEEFFKAWHSLEGGHFHILVERFYFGENYRCLYVAGEPTAIVKMRPPSVLGDGVRTVKELIDSKDGSRSKHPTHFPLLPLNSTFFRENQAVMSSVLAAGERLFLSKVSNLQRGGDAIDATHLLSSGRLDHLKSLIEPIPELLIAGVDLILDEGDDPERDVVLEVNASPQLSIHHFPWEGQPRDVAADVISMLFPETVTWEAAT